MAETALDVQTERAFQKQKNVTLGVNRLTKVGRATPSKAAVAKVKKLRKTTTTRFHKTVGLGFKTPKAAIEGVYVDNKCPFTGAVSIRGRILRGLVVSTKMKRTIVIRRDYLHWIPKYQRFEKRHSNLSAHCSPCFTVKPGDVVTVGQCRPLAKTVRFNVLKVEPNEITQIQQKKRFRPF